MNWFRPITFVSMLLVAVPAVAQQAPPVARQPLRGYLIAGAGSSVSTPQTALTVNAEIAENVTSDVQVYISAAFYDDIMSQATKDEIALAGDVLEAITIQPWSLQGRDRARSFTVGGKFLVPTGSPVRPYIGGGFGVLNVHRFIRDQFRGNITEAYAAQFGSADGVVDPTQDNTNHPMTEVATGVGIVIRRAYVDVGYRWRKAFHNVNDSFEVSQVGVSVGVKF
jgi:opacity protein-like surface antigen